MVERRGIPSCESEGAEQAPNRIAIVVDVLEGRLVQEVVAEEDQNRAVKLAHAALLHEALAGEEAVSARLGYRHET